MMYQDMPAGESQHAFGDNDTPRPTAPPPYRANLYSEPSQPLQDSKVQRSSTSADDSSISSSEDGGDLVSSEDDILTQATEFTRRAQPPAYTPLPLSQPVVIPQTVAGTGQAFARCWAPALAPYNIPASDFVEFIDNLNVVATANPPLQVLDLIGGVLGMVPHHIFQLAGGGVQALAKLGTVAVSKSRTDLYMQKVNKEFFVPRGLRATITSRDAMAMSLRLPGSAAKLAPLTADNMHYSMVERRLEGLRPYISELRFDVPLPVPQTTVLAKMSAAQVKRQTAKAEKKMMKQRWKQVERMEYNGKLSKAERKEQRLHEKGMRRLDKDARKAEKDAKKDTRKGGSAAEKAELKLQEELAKIEDQRRQKADAFNTEEGVSSGSRRAKKDKESKQAMKALWILIENV
ncbi:hypothetical protein PVAG01_09265 [Phlyctema vagabunda]|uniref:Uncharacterized protein n=1 Tax=Phlyctema vagabunda TaxID=108571 RepID=A0ABR4P6W3_9HELO